MLQIVATTDEPIPAPTPTESEISFEDFYLLFPRHEARKDAHRAWEKVPRTEHVGILIALFAWRKVWADRGEGTRFTPLPASWLNGERWTDELPPGYTLMPRINGHAQQSASAPVEPKGPRQPIPDHVLAILAKLKEGRK